MFGRVSRLAVTSFSVALLLTACGSGGGSSSAGGSGYGGGSRAAGGSTGGGGADQRITIQNFAFDPSALTLPSGEDVSIEVTNDDEGVEHSFTLDDDSLSQDVEGGETKTVTLNLTQGIGWHCEYHPHRMKGTINVS